jgi:kynureninase
MKEVTYEKLIKNTLKDETTLRMEDVEKVLSEKGSQIALVLFSGVHYYTGQFLDIERITRAAHEQVSVIIKSS